METPSLTCHMIAGMNWIVFDVYIYTEFTIIAMLPYFIREPVCHNFLGSLSVFTILWWVICCILGGWELNTFINRSPETLILLTFKS